MKCNPAIFTRSKLILKKKLGEKSFSKKGRKTMALVETVLLW
jgi:hypothetical protein